MGSQRSKTAEYTREYARKNAAKQNSQRRERVDRESPVRTYVYLFAHPCVDCGEQDPEVLEFDHVRGKKDKAVSKMVTHAYGIPRIEREIAKCDVRCGNCHRRVTNKRGDFARHRTKIVQGPVLAGKDTIVIVEDRSRKVAGALKRAPLERDAG